jgi:hypothetical protein
LLPKFRKGQQPLQFNPTSDGGRSFRLRFPGKGRNVKGAMTRSGAGIRYRMNLSLTDAFGKFGAKPSNRLRGLSAIATDGALVLNCSTVHFGHPTRGVLRYEDRLSREPAGAKVTGLLGEHLTLARDGALPIRMIVTAAAGEKTSSSCHVRPDLIGKIVTFDGDHFIIDFTRREELRPAVPSGRRK